MGRWSTLGLIPLSRPSSCAIPAGQRRFALYFRHHFAKPDAFGHKLAK
ncbi:MAG: hypothetical protein ACI87C_001380 [Paraperlucidibaca sp.]|jgi:hypothetical protein